MISSIWMNKYLNHFGYISAPWVILKTKLTTTLFNNMNNV